MEMFFIMNYGWNGVFWIQNFFYIYIYLRNRRVNTFFHTWKPIHHWYMPNDINGVCQKGHASQIGSRACTVRVYCNVRHHVANISIISVSQVNIISHQYGQTNHIGPIKGMYTTSDGARRMMTKLAHKSVRWIAQSHDVASQTPIPDNLVPFQVCMILQNLISSIKYFDGRYCIHKSIPSWWLRKG